MKGISILKVFSYLISIAIVILLLLYYDLMKAASDFNWNALLLLCVLPFFTFLSGVIIGKIFPSRKLRLIIESGVVVIVLIIFYYFIW